MKKLLPLALAFGLMMPLAHAQKTEPAKEKPAVADTAKPEKKVKETADKKKEAKPELSDADKELLAAAKKEADTLTKAQRAKLLELLNKGDSKALQAVEGVGEVRAKNIMAKRPFAKPEDAAMVDGVGIETFKNLVASVKPAPKTEKPKTDEKTEKPKEKPAKPETKPADKEKPAPKKPE